MKTISQTIVKALGYGLLMIGVVMAIAPFLWMISTSLKGNSQVFTIPPKLIPNPIRWENYAKMAHDIPIVRMMLNTVFMTASITLGQVVFCCLAGYSFARLRFPGRDQIFMVYLGTMMVPFMVVLVPTYVIMRELGWVNKYAAVIVPGLFGSAYGTFLMRQFFLTLPKELEDAAVLDGCNPFQVFALVFLPLVKPAVTTLSIFTIIGVWNDFLWPMIVLKSDNLRPLTVGLASFQGMYDTKFNYLMAGTLVSVLPMVVLYILAQKYFVEGIALTGIKG